MAHTERLRQRLFPRGQSRETHRLIGHAVIGVAQRNEVMISRGKPRHQQREFIRFASRVGEVHHLKSAVLRKGGNEALAKLRDIGMEIDRGAMN